MVRLVLGSRSSMGGSGVEDTASDEMVLFEVSSIEMQYDESDDNDDTDDADNADVADDADDYWCGPLLFFLYRRSQLEMYSTILYRSLQYETVPSPTPNSWALYFLTPPLPVSTQYSVLRPAMYRNRH